jgi:cytochrome P450
MSPKAQALRWIGEPYSFLRECAQSYGEAFTLDMGLDEGKYVVLSHPDALRGVLTAEVGALRICNGVLAPMLGPRSLLLIDGEQHLRERRFLVPGFQYRAIGAYGSMIRNVLTAAMQSWSRGHEFLAQETLQDISFEVILRVVFGGTGGLLREELKREVMSLLNDRRMGLGLLGRPSESSTMPALGAFWRKFEHVRDLALELVTSTRGASQPGTIMASLSQAVDDHGDTISNDHLRDEVLTLLATGHETTTTAMSWGLYWLARHDEARARLRGELSALGPAPDPLTYSELPYLDAVCKEVLRICPVVPSLFRQVIDRPFVAGGHLLPPGTFLSPSIYLAHHREETFPEPDKFDPSRFLGRTYSPYEYLPFGGGSRRCIGMHLALFEMKVVLATFLSLYDYELAAPQGVRAVRRLVTVAPGGGLRLRITNVR